jgi:hypothetical protein
MPLQPGAGEDAPPPALDLSETVFSDDDAPRAEQEEPEAEAEQDPEQHDPESSAAVATETSDEPAEGSDEAAPAAAEEE